MPPAVMSMCPDCEGKGTMPDGSACPGCKGAGMTIKPVKPGT